MKALSDLSYDMHLSLWSRLLVLFGVPLHVTQRLELDESNRLTSTIGVVVKGQTPNVVYNAEATAALQKGQTRKLWPLWLRTLLFIVFLPCFFVALTTTSATVGWASGSACAAIYLALRRGENRPAFW